MGAKRIVIVGGVAGGASAAARARRLSEDAEILLFERGPHVSFANCGLPYHIGGEIPEREKLILQTPQSLLARLNLDVRVDTEIVAVDRAKKEVTAREVHGGRVYTERYDALVLATGAAPLKPPIPGIERPGHFVLRNVPDLDAILAWVKTHGARNAVVVGGGYIGLETAEQLHRRGLKVALAEALPQVMAPLDGEMAAWLHDELRRHEIDLHLNDGVACFEAPKAGEAAAASVVVLKSGARLPADVVVLGLGVRPEVTLAKAAGLELGERGGIRVDAHMRTSDAAIWAAGDSVEVRDPVTGAWTLVALAGPANRQGRIAADNIFGRASEYRGTWGTAVLRLFELVAACTGANERVLRRAGRAFQALHLHAGSHAGYFPGAQPIATKILFDPKDGRLLGAQAVGTDGVDKRIDVLATALQAGMTVHDLAELELAYAPPFGSAKDPINMAGMAAQNVLAGDAEVFQWNEVAERDAAATVLLDVREETEVAAGKIDGAVNIPLPQLRKRLNELPKDREVLVYCQAGQRAYFASRILKQMGYRCRYLSGSYRTWSIAAKH